MIFTMRFRFEFWVLICFAAATGCGSSSGNEVLWGEWDLAEDGSIQVSLVEGDDTESTIGSSIRCADTSTVSVSAVMGTYDEMSHISVTADNNAGIWEEREVVDASFRISSSVRNEVGECVSYLPEGFYAIEAERPITNGAPPARLRIVYPNGEVLTFVRPG